MTGASYSLYAGQLMRGSVTGSKRIGARMMQVFISVVSTTYTVAVFSFSMGVVFVPSGKTLRATGRQRCRVVGWCSLIGGAKRVH